MLIRYEEVDLREPLVDLYVDPRYRQLGVIARWGQRPLGVVTVTVPDNDRVVRADQLRRELAGWLGWDIWERFLVEDAQRGRPSPTMTLPSISVLVCTRDRPLSLKRCLEALAALDYPAYEVVVVDNASRDPQVAEVVHGAGFRYVREPCPGLNWARRRAVEEARHGLVAFIDDDALASAGWLHGIAEGFEDPTVMAVTGLVLPAEIETDAQHEFLAYGGMAKGFTPYSVDRRQLDQFARFRANDWGVGANMAFRRSVFNLVGNFDPALDVGTPTNGGGDLEFLHRVVDHGCRLRYEPAALVRHVDRRDREGFRRQIRNNGTGFGSYLLRVAHRDPSQRRAVARFAIQGWAKPWLVDRLARGIVTRDPWLRELAWLETRGALASPAAYRRSCRANRADTSASVERTTR